jgi:hypothetical protein
VSAPAAIVAVDIGMRAGLAEYSHAGRLLTYRSHNFGSRARLCDGVCSILHGLPDLQVYYEPA